MKEEMLFNIPIQELRRQIESSKTYACDKDSPISTIKGETLEPCIRGAKKIAADPELKAMVKDILLS